MHLLFQLWYIHGMCNITLLMQLKKACKIKIKVHPNEKLLYIHEKGMCPMKGVYLREKSIEWHVYANEA